VTRDDAVKPIFGFLEDHAGLHLAYYVSDLVPVTLDEVRASRLDLPEGTAALSFEEVGYDPTGRPILRAVSYFRDDRVRFRLMRRRAPA
jgi:DNA-binding GntR family transcriptional regulator